jgi:hypothetical protein
MYIERHRRREIVRMSLIPPPHIECYANHLAALQMVDGPETRTAAPGDEPVQRPALQLLKSLDDLDEVEDEDDDAEDLEDEEEEDEDEEDDLDEDYEDEDEEDDDEDEDEDEDEEDEDEDGGVKPLKMSSSGPGSSRRRK